MNDARWRASLGAVVLLTLGCGRTTAGADPIEGSGGGAPSVSVGGPPPKNAADDGGPACGALGLEANDPLLVAGQGSSLWLVLANGELVPLGHGLGSELAPDGQISIESVTVEGGFALVKARIRNFDGHLPVSELALFTRDGQRLWRYTPRDPGDGVIRDILLDEQGFVAFYESSLELGETIVVVTPAGESFVGAGSTPYSTPDSQGWMAVARHNPNAPAGQLYSYGFLHPNDGAYLAVRFLPLAGVMARPTKSVHGPSSFVYVTEQGSTLSAVLEDRNEAHLFELPPLAATINGEIRLNVHVAERWAIVNNDGLPVLRIDLETKQAFPVDASAVDVREPYPYIVSGGDRFLAQSAGQILWRLDASAGAFLPVNVGDTLRVLDASYCTSNVAFGEDGRLALPLTDGESGGIYLEQPGGTWSRIGLAFTNVTFANAKQLGEGWLISTDDGSNTYCPRAVSDFGTSPPPGTLLGDSLQIVLPERGLTRALPLGPDSLAAVHRSGLCVALYEADALTLYDPVSDASRVVLSSGPELGNWDMQTAFF